MDLETQHVRVKNMTEDNMDCDYTPGILIEYCRCDDSSDSENGFFVYKTMHVEEGEQTFTFHKKRILFMVYYGLMETIFKCVNSFPYLAWNQECVHIFGSCWFDTGKLCRTCSHYTGSCTNDFGEFVVVLQASFSAVNDEAVVIDISKDGGIWEDSSDAIVDYCRTPTPAGDFNIYDDAGTHWLWMCDVWGFDDV